MPRLAALSVDLDEIDCYLQIHGLALGDQISDLARQAVYRRALPRLARLFDELELRATFFAIGRDLRSDANRRALAALHAAGHEIANHTLDHPYDLVRLEEDEQRRQVREAATLIQSVTGSAPRGFRAPGYTVSDGLVRVLQEEGVRYDSSVFPCPTYYAAKATAMLGIRLRGRKSHSVLDRPAVLRAPRDPYFTGDHYWQRGDGLLELPIGVTGFTGGYLPYIGTTVVLWGARGAKALTRRMLGRPLVNLELHGIDLVDAEKDGLQALAPHQPDLRRSAREKADAIRAAVTTLRDAGYELVTLTEAAEAFEPTPQLAPSASTS